MKSLTITMAVVLASSASAVTKSDGQRVVVCLEGGNHDEVVDVAAKKASIIFRSAGVSLEWHTNRSFCRGQRDHAIIVSLSTSTPKTFHPGALACAYPYEGVSIQVFYDRIGFTFPELLPSLLAHVFVHEIAHILQNIDRHSNSGIMKAHWSFYDYTLMKMGQLGFTGLDIEMIHDGLAARAARTVRPAVGALVAAEAP